jgi:hypothetical protein
LRDRPVLDVRQAYYYGAYQSIARGRPVSMGGPLAIPVSEILAYCYLFKISKVNERDRLLRYVTMIDNAYLEYVGEKRKK